MPDQPTGTPAPDNNPQGTVQALQQPQSTPQNPADTTAQTPPPATQTPAAQPADLAALQQRLEQAEKMARHYQSQHSQARQQLQAVTGAQPPADPLQQRIERLSKAGIDTADAQVFARAFQVELDPIQQENKQLRAALEGQSQAQQAYQQAAAANPELFADQAIGQAAWQALQEAALSGQPQFVTPDYAFRVAAGEYAASKQPWKQPGQTPPPAPQPFRPLGTMNMGGPGGSYAPNVQPAHPQQPEDPAIAAAADQMAKRWSNGKTLSQLSQP